MGERRLSFMQTGSLIFLITELSSQNIYSKSKFSLLTDVRVRFSLVYRASISQVLHNNN